MMELNELVMKQLIWNKEKIKVITVDENGKWVHSKIDRIEFLMYDFEGYTIDWFESGKGIYRNEEISIIIFHLSKEKKQ